MIRKLWPYLLGAAALAVMYLDRPIGLRAGHGGGRGNWTVEGWTLDSVWPMLLGIIVLAVAILEIVVRSRFRFLKIKNQ